MKNDPVGSALVDTAMKKRWTVEDSAKASAVTIHRFPSGIIDHTRIGERLGGVIEEGRERHAFRQRQRRGVLSCPHVDMAVGDLDKMSGTHRAMCVRRAETICRAMPTKLVSLMAGVARGANVSVNGFGAPGP